MVLEAIGTKLIIEQEEEAEKKSGASASAS